MSEQTINYDAFGYTLSHRMVSIGGLLFAKKLCKNLRQKLDSEVSRGKFYLDSWSNSEDSRSLKTSSTQDFRDFSHSSDYGKTFTQHVSVSMSSKRLRGSSSVLIEGTTTGSSENTSFRKKMDKIPEITELNKKRISISDDVTEQTSGPTKKRSEPLIKLPSSATGRNRRHIFQNTYQLFPEKSFGLYRGVVLERIESIVESFSRDHRAISLADTLEEEEEITARDDESKDLNLPVDVTVLKIADAIKAEVLSLGLKRYRVVVVVSAGTKKQSSLLITSRCFFYPPTDTSVNYTRRDFTKSYFLTAHVYAIYKE